MRERTPPATLKMSGCCPDLGTLLDPSFFKALCDPSRLEILGRLARGGGPLTVSDIAAGGQIDISVVSRHLSQLRGAGIVAAEKRGKRVLYRVRAGGAVRFFRDLADALEQCCPEEKPGQAEGPS
jgi:ArsR family transcriptional regulator